MPSGDYRNDFGFNPPLVVQRRSFCIGVLKQERIKSVLELGCGEGSLIKVLCQPPCFLDEDFPPIQNLSSAPINFFKNDGEVPKEMVDRKLRKIDEEILERLPKQSIWDRELHLELIVGVDVNPDRLKLAEEILGIIPDRLKNQNFSTDEDLPSPDSRLGPQRIELWNGDLSTKNMNYFGIECIIMSEVIEHLTPEELDRSIPLIFSEYKPKFAIITTPNHEFNQHLDCRPRKRPGEGKKHRFPDPTHRTDRFFRDDDHKFEWTQEEFKQWCESVRLEFDYEYEISGCGSYTNCFGSSEIQNPGDLIPKPEFPRKFFATQTAVFKRKNIPDSSMISARVKNGPLLESGSHTLLFTYDYPVDPILKQPIDYFRILNLAKDYLKTLQFCREKKIRLRELWLCQEGIGLACHGKMTELLRSFAVEEGWDISLDPCYERLNGMDSIWIDWLKNPSQGDPESEINEFSADRSAISSVDNLSSISWDSVADNQFDWDKQEVCGDQIWLSSSSSSDQKLPEKDSQKESFDIIHWADNLNLDI